MRTITENLKERLIAQSEEAKLQGLTKTASHLTDIAKNVSIRKNAESYTYSNNDFESDVENALWGAVVRFADFHNVSVDGIIGQSIVEKFAKDLVIELRAKTGTTHGVGAYESNVPGESKQTVIVSVDEDE
jgi:replicative superfamily II helicase